MPSPDPLLLGEKRKLSLLARDLLEWAGREGRDFPWRAPGTSVYERIAVEVLLQRTTATAVARFYESFFSRFDSWETLSTARAEDLETFLKPLGLWRRRAASLLGLAGYAAGTGGLFPSNPTMHAGIPAVGQYVSNAVLLFQHGIASPLLDVNMARVIERFLRPRKLVDIRYDPWLQDAAAWYAKGGDAVTRNWAMLDFAALVCKARSPLCQTCPVSARCRYFRSTATATCSLSVESSS